MDGGGEGGAVPICGVSIRQQYLGVTCLDATALFSSLSMWDSLELNERCGGEKMDVYDFGAIGGVIFE